MLGMVVRVFLVLGLILAAQASPMSPHKKSVRAREVDKDVLKELEELLTEELNDLKRNQETGEEKAEKKDYGPPPGWTSKQTASEKMRTFARASKRTQKSIAAMMEKDEEFTRGLDSVTENSDLIRRVIDLHLETRADLHPTCTTPFTCDERTFIDGKEYRLMDGTCNNIDNPEYASASVQHQRLLEPTYDKWQFQRRGLGGVLLPNPRTVSNLILKAASTTPENTHSVSNVMFAFLQFLDHDLILTPEGELGPTQVCCPTATTNSGFCMPIIVPAGDETFAEGYCMDGRRSFTYLRHCDGSEQQNQINDITGWIDASNVYGSSEEEMKTLRTYEYGLLEESQNDMLSFYHGDDEGFPCDQDKCKNAGDVRCNVVPSLTAMHTLWQREHNRIALYLSTNTDWSDEKIYQIARKIVIGEMQHVVYEEVLPIILDEDFRDEYKLTADYAYDDTIDPSIYSSFAILFRFGHALVPDDFYGNLLKYMWKKPAFLTENLYENFETLQNHLDTTLVKDPDETLLDSIINDLFFSGTETDFDAFDLGALNTFRTRDWGTQMYTDYKFYCGFGDTSDWDDLVGVTHTQEMVDKLSADEAYENAVDVDLFPGAMTEAKVGDSFLGKVGNCILAKQFGALKDGDRHFYTTSDSTVGFSADQLVEIKKSSIKSIICMNSKVDSVPTEAFKVNSDSSDFVDCDDYRDGTLGMNLSEWLGE